MRTAYNSTPTAKESARKPSYGTPSWTSGACQGEFEGGGVHLPPESNELEALYMPHHGMHRMTHSELNDWMTFSATSAQTSLRQYSTHNANGNVAETPWKRTLRLRTAAPFNQYYFEKLGLTYYDAHGIWQEAMSGNLGANRAVSMASTGGACQGQSKSWRHKSSLTHWKLDRAPPKSKWPRQIPEQSYCNLQWNRRSKRSNV